MFDNFSDSGRTLMTLAREHALRLEHESIAPGHLLLAILEEDGSGAEVLRRYFRVDLERLRRDIEAGLGAGAGSGEGNALPFTPAARKVLEFTLVEATRMGHKELGSEHVLLGMLRLEHGPVTEALRGAAVDLDTARLRVGGPGG